MRVVSDKRYVNMLNRQNTHLFNIKANGKKVTAMLSRLKNILFFWSCAGFIGCFTWLIMARNSSPVECISVPISHINNICSQRVAWGARPKISALCLAPAVSLSKTRCVLVYHMLPIIAHKARPRVESWNPGWFGFSVSLCHKETYQWRHSGSDSLFVWSMSRKKKWQNVTSNLKLQVHNLQTNEWNIRLP